jgi:hypothetical protein
MYCKYRKIYFTFLIFLFCLKLFSQKSNNEIKIQKISSKKKYELNIQINKDFTEDNIYVNNFRFEILDTNFKEIKMTTKGRGQRCFDCNVSKLKKIEPQKNQIKIRDRYVKLIIPLEIVETFGNSIAWYGYYFNSEKNYIRISYTDSKKTYYSDTIPLYVW